LEFNLLTKVKKDGKIVQKRITHAIIMDEIFWRHPCGSDHVHQQSSDYSSFWNCFECDERWEDELWKH